MAILEIINSCIHESLKERIWVSAYVNVYIGVNATLLQLLAGCIHHMPVLRCHMIMT